jgi:Arc/MetJ-type ribon-helix-helix transcriptional regulator
MALTVTSPALSADHPLPRDRFVINFLIPNWYRIGMSRQIAVRLPDDLVEFVDELVAAGRGASRAAIVTRALERERRREVAARDAAILASGPGDPDLDRLAAFAATTPMDDLG